MGQNTHPPACCASAVCSAPLWLEFTCVSPGLGRFSQNLSKSVMSPDHARSSICTSWKDRDIELLIPRLYPCNLICCKQEALRQEGEDSPPSAAPHPPRRGSVGEQHSRTWTRPWISKYRRKLYLLLIAPAAGRRLLT